MKPHLQRLVPAGGAPGSRGPDGTRQAEPPSRRRESFLFPVSLLYRVEGERSLPRFRHVRPRQSSRAVGVQVARSRSEREMFPRWERNQLCGGTRAQAGVRLCPCPPVAADRQEPGTSLPPSPPRASRTANVRAGPGEEGRSGGRRGGGGGTRGSVGHAARSRWPVTHTHVLAAASSDVRTFRIFV